MGFRENPGKKTSVIFSSAFVTVIFVVAFSAGLSGTFNNMATGVTTSGSMLGGNGENNPQTRSASVDSSPFDARTYLGVYFSCSATEPISGDRIEPYKRVVSVEHPNGVPVANAIISPRPFEETPQDGVEIGLRSPCGGRQPTSYADPVTGNTADGKAIAREAEKGLVSTTTFAESEVGSLGNAPLASHQAHANQAEIVTMVG